MTEVTQKSKKSKQLNSIERLKQADVPILKSHVKLMYRCAQAHDVFNSPAIREEVAFSYDAIHTFFDEITKL